MEGEAIRPPLSHENVTIRFGLQGTLKIVGRHVPEAVRRSGKN